MNQTSIEAVDQPGRCPPELPERGVWLGRIVPGTEASSNAVAHVSNVEYVRWLDQVGQAHLGALGWTSDQLLGSGAMWFVARHEVDYRRETHAGETLMVATWIRNLRRVKSWRDTIIWRQAEDEAQVVCTASTLWVHVDLDHRRPVPPPTDMAAALRDASSDAVPSWRARV
ncbi:MAG: acyl-CoA thioesterase [Phycisphaerales bacterium]|jgi:acyl-CoA thioester hydrolase|nr:acyl-CoA thioesterase [Phycisphaerales bacterium]